MALDDSGLLAAPEVREHTGVLIGTALGGIGLLLKQHKIFLNHGPKRVSPLVIPFGIPDMISAYISIAHQLRGPNHSIVSACASGANAIGEAYQLIRRREMVAMLAGGSEAINEFVVAGFCAARSLSTSNDMPQAASRPFDRSRNGFVMAEGAAVLVLESREHALARGAPIYAELVGYGSCSDGFHFTKPRPDGSGAMRAMEEAIRYAGIPLGEIDYINAHGTSTIDGDRHETEAVKALFGEQAKRIVISSTKSMTGHMLGAAGAFEAAVCVLAIRDGIAPPTINYRECDPECDLDFVPNVARHKEINVAVSNSFGFGGHNVSLVIKRHE
jgi:3-oxoacyl-[acyl-carrier-protein] synthase II